MENIDILKMYDLVFEDFVKCYLENLTEEERNKISEEDIKTIVHNLIYKSEYMWEVINETIQVELDYLKGDKEND